MTVQSLYNAVFGVHMNGPFLSESCYKGTILPRIYGKMIIQWPFSHESFVKLHG